MGICEAHCGIACKKLFTFDLKSDRLALQRHSNKLMTKTKQKIKLEHAGQLKCSFPKNTN